MAPRLRWLWSFLSLFAIVIGVQQEPSLAGDSADPIANSPAAFQSPINDSQPPANAAAAIDNQSATRIPGPTTAASASQMTLPEKARPLSHASRSDRVVSRITPSIKRAGDLTNSTTQSVVTVLGGLGVVLGLFFVTVWLFRGSTSKAGHSLPEEVVEPLGRTVVVKGQQLQLIRFGRKLVLISHCSAGIETISEISDPVEVDRIAGLCHGKGAMSSTRAFQGMLDGFAGNGSSDRSDAEDRRRRRWERDRLTSRGRTQEDDDV